MVGRFFGRCRSGWRKAILALGAMVALAGGMGCADFLNPSLLRLFETSADGGNVTFAGVNAPTGHVPILFKNSARIADNVFRFVIQADTSVRPDVVDELLRENPQLSRDAITDILQAIIDDDPVDLEVLNLPPRVRLTLAVVNVDGGVQRLEFLDGLRLVRPETGAGGGLGSSDELPVDLTENTNDTFIVQCEIDSIFIERIDVFVPVVLRVTTFVIDADGRDLGEECLELNDPAFDNLELDEGFDPSEGTFGTRRNIDPRFFPPPLTTLQCGAVVIVELSGDLFLPFRELPDDCGLEDNPPANGFAPAYLVDDAPTIDAIPGRYGVKISIRG